MSSCRDCGCSIPADAIESSSGRCDKCQTKRDEYYDERMRQEHACGRKPAYQHHYQEGDSDNE